MKYESRKKFTRKLALSIISLSIVGLIIVFVIGNTIFRTIIYENVIGITYGDVRIVSQEIDNWFDNGKHIVENLTRLWTELGTDYIEPIAHMFLDEYYFLSEVFAGFPDGSAIRGTDWIPDDDWISTTRPWYIAAQAAQGEIVTTIPYMPSNENLGMATSMAKWIPDLDGREAVVAIVIDMGTTICMINEYNVAGGGYLVLIGPEGEIISHPQTEYTIGAERTIYLSDIPNGSLLMQQLNVGYGVSEIEDKRLGPAYLMTFYQEATGWTLAAIVPESAVMGPVSQYVLVLMLISGAVVVALLLLTLFFMRLLTKDMEDSQVVEERLRIIIDNMPLVSNFRDRNFNILECNATAAKVFGLSSKEEYIERFFELTPKFQPDGSNSDEKAQELISKAFETGHIVFEWLHQKPDGTPIPTEVTLIKVDWQGEENLVAFVRDLRERNEAFTDALTSAKNRRFFMEEAEKELKKCTERGLDYSLIMVDVDHFKSINDNYGHPTGDEVLKILVARMKHALKRDTLIARYGGEEFVISLPETSIENAMGMAERLRKTVDASKFVTKENELGVTISLGVACYPKDGMELTEIIANADKALYNAKNTGRNKVIKF